MNMPPINFEPAGVPRECVSQSGFQGWREEIRFKDDRHTKTTRWLAVLSISRRYIYPLALPLNMALITWVSLQSSAHNGESVSRKLKDSPATQYGYPYHHQCPEHPAATGSQ